MTARRMSWVAAAAMLTLSGCAGLTPGAPGAPGAAGAPGAPPAAVPQVDARAPAAWQAPLPTAKTVAAPAAQGWTRFDDPWLAGLTSEALRASPGVAAAATRIEQARAARAAAAGLPNVDAAGSLARARQAPGLPTAGTGTVGLLASWELDLFGAVQAGRGAAQARLDAAQSAAQSVRLSLAAEVALTYTTFRACEAQVAQAQVDAESRTETARVTELAARAGMQAPATAALARASAAQGRAQLTSQRAQCDTLMKALVALTARDEALLRATLAPGQGRLPQPAAAVPAVLPADLLTQRPDLLEAGLAVAAAAADRQGADARLWPRVSLAGSLGAVRVSSAAGSSEGATWSLGPLQVSFPVFDNGLRRANQAAARAAYDEAVVQYQSRVRTAVREVEEALVALQSTQARGEDAAVAAEGFEASFRAAEARFKGGLGSAFELEDARRSASAARSALIELQRERVAAWISLDRALGGGWTAAPHAEAPHAAR